MPARTIVVAYPNSLVHTPIEVPMVRLRERGHRIILWTPVAEGPLHHRYVALGLEAHGEDLEPWDGPLRHVQNAYRLADFLRRVRADVVFSHLQTMNLSAVLARRMGLMDADVVAFRHSATAFHLAPPRLRRRAESRNEALVDQFLNHACDRIVVPGTSVRDLVIREGADPAKVSVMPYQYDFDAMERTVEAGRVADLRAEFPAQLRMISVMRFVPMKRHELTIHTLAALVSDGRDANLTLLDGGPELDAIKCLVERLGLTSRVQFVGFTRDVLTHLMAADLVLCPSLTDASNNVIKEAGLVRRPVVVVRGVGDFDDYIVDAHNGFLADADAFSSRAAEVATGLMSGQIDGDAIGANLAAAVRNRFAIREEIVDRYEELLNPASGGVCK